MEQISGVNNWKLVIRREAEGVTVLRAETCDRKAALPEELFGLPVTALGHHALTPGRRVPEGEEVLVTCGPAGEEWDNRQLEDLRLPESLRRVGDYALFNCTALRTLRLADTVSYWGGGVLMNCRQLDTFHLTCTGREGELMDYLAGELPRGLDMTLSY
ncbi:MAG: leucine-rich repeat protein, partial [Oscillospiraceae bacterium]|nr:leucine-rich repeat protein [Oscillospiraceae bacterium]